MSFINFISVEGDTIILGLKIVSTSTTSVQLSWQALSDVIFEYEVAYLVDTVCSGNHVSVSDEYTIYSPRSMNNTINVFELQPGICYVFAVRAYNPLAIRFGEYTVVNGSTIAEGNN